MEMLKTIPNVSFNTAKVMLEQYSLAEILSKQVDEKTISELKYDSNYKVGVVRAEKIFKELDKKHNHAKILTVVKGITKATAKIILGAVEFKKIVLCTYNMGDIANTKKNHKRNIGKSIEAKLRKIFPPPKRTNKKKRAEPKKEKTRTENKNKGIVPNEKKKN